MSFAFRFGKMPTTSDLRRTSRFKRSWGLSLQIWCQCSIGKAFKGGDVGGGVVEHLREGGPAGSSRLAERL